MLVSPLSFYPYYGVGNYCSYAGAFIQGLISLSLWGLYLKARLSGDLILGNWAINVEDLAVGAHPPLSGKRLTWGGVRRFEDRLPRRGAIAQGMGRFLKNALFRRVHPVETKLYASLQHVFAIASVVLLLTRVITNLTQLGNEGLPSRSLVQPVSMNSHSDGLGISVLIRYEQPSAEAQRLITGSAASPFNISIAFQTNSTTSFRNVSNQCNLMNIRTQPDTNKVNRADQFWLYNCYGVDGWWNRTLDERLGFQFTMTTRVGRQDSQNYPTPSIWLVAGIDLPDLRTPYLVPPIRPVPDVHTIYHTHYAVRRFVSSSPVWDAISGSKPGFDTVSLYPPSQVYSRPITATDDPANPMLYSSGFIRWPQYLVSSTQISQSDLRSDVQGSNLLLEVTEEYRTGSSFDILASVGGLLALLQGLHMFLFGRPLFWGVFGTKLIAPFGLAGKFAPRSFRQRLHDHYYHDSHTPSNIERGGANSEGNINMTQFLLDFVIDLGPVSAPCREMHPQQPEPHPAYTQVELGEMGRSPTLLSSTPSIMEKDDRSAKDPFLDIPTLRK